MEKLIQEKISADHLLYVSLKYTKTADVILNLIKRWRSMIELGMELLLKEFKKKKKVKSIPSAPVQKIVLARQVFKRNEIIMKAIELFLFFKRAENAEKERENEFRKHITLKIFDKGDWVLINVDTLKEYSEIMENFINEVKKLVS